MSNRLIAPKGTWRGAPMDYIVRKLGLSSGLQLCLDAGDDKSYASGQSWLDRSGNGYDFYRGSGSGSDSADPTFNGTAGQRVAGNYFSFDGGDYFTYDATNETWMQNIHKDNALFTLAFIVYFPGFNQSGLWGTNGGSPSSGTGAHSIASSSGDITFAVVNSGSAAINQTFSSVYTNTAGWRFLALSVNEAAGGAASFLFLSGNATTFNGTYSSPSSGDASQNLQFGARGGGNAPIENNCRMGAVMAWSRALSVDEIRNLMRVSGYRFGSWVA